MKKSLLLLLPVAAIIGFITFNGFKDAKKVKASATTIAVAANAGLTLPSGFSAVAIAEGLDGPRHLVVTPQNDIYVHMQNARDGKKGIVVLHETGDKTTVKTSFGDYGGTGIYIKKGYLYASSSTEVFRYKLNAKDEVIDPNKPEKIVTGLIAKRMHQPKAIMLDNAGNLYVNIGAFSNACSDFDKKDGKGCPVLDSAAGIWQFKADKLNQTYKDGVRFATGLRNVVGLDWNTQDNRLFVMQHGRDALHDLFPKLYTSKQSADLPAECMFELKKGDNAGWPYLYYDWMQHKKMVGPEYGGDGKKVADAKYLEPVAAYPGHFAPDGLLFYTGNQFPAKYKNGAFIAFHGSWNRAPEPQEGYCVAFQPFKNGKPFGKYEIFANGFAGATKTPDGAAHRPCGLAMGPDGSLYVTDDQKGTIYKISYRKS